VNVAVLVGGRGGRIGRDKGLLEVCGRRFIEVIVEEMKGCNILIVCRDREQAKIYSRFGRTAVDVYSGCGPIAGIYTALVEFKDSTAVVPVDCPLVKRGILEYLTELCSGYDAAVPIWGDGRLEPLIACYSYRSAEKIRRSIEAGERRVYVALRRMRTRFVPVDVLRKFDRDLRSFINVNTWEDYLNLLRVVGCL